MTEPPTLIAALLCSDIEQPDGPEMPGINIVGVNDRLVLPDHAGRSWPAVHSLRLFLIVRDGIRRAPYEPALTLSWLHPDGTLDIALNRFLPPTRGHFDYWATTSFEVSLSGYGIYQLKIVINDHIVGVLAFGVFDHVR